MIKLDRKILDKKTLKKLQNELPVGAARIIQERLLAKNKDHFYSLSTIRRVLNPNDNMLNVIIIDEAIEYRDEYLKKQAIETAMRAEAILNESKVLE